MTLRGQKSCHASRVSACGNNFRRKIDAEDEDIHRLRRAIIIMGVVVQCFSLTGHLEGYNCRPRDYRSIQNEVNFRDVVDVL